MALSDNIIDELISAGVDMRKIILGMKDNSISESISESISGIKNNSDIELSEALLASELEHKAKINESKEAEEKYEAELTIAISESKKIDTNIVEPNFTEACLAFFKGQQITLSQRIINFATKAVELGYDKEGSEYAANIAGRQLAKMIIEDKMYPYLTTIENVVFDQEHESYIHNGFMFYLRTFFFGNY